MSALRVPTWDVPVRLVHWLMVLLVAGAWWTGDTGRMEWHRYCGYGLLGLLVFRIYWGFAGSRNARFRNFVKGPRALIGYLQGKNAMVSGHNPLGAWSVLALLGALLLQVGLGLFAVDVDGIESGPLSLYVSFDTGRAAAEWHETVFTFLQIIVAVHILAVLFYVLVRKQNLIAAMWHGKRNYGVEGMSGETAASRVKLVVGVVLAVAFTWAVASAFQF